jgi:hypothetical protein
MRTMPMPPRPGGVAIAAIGGLGVTATARRRHARRPRGLVGLAGGRLPEVGRTAFLAPLRGD